MEYLTVYADMREIYHAEQKYKDPIGFNCTDSFWSLTCKR